MRNSWEKWYNNWQEQQEDQGLLKEEGGNKHEDVF